MATLLYRRQGDQFNDNAGNRLISGKVFYYQAGTSILQATFSDNAGTVANQNPISLNGDGRLTLPVYFGSTNNYKEVVTDQFGAIVSPWPFDNIPCAISAPSVANFAQTLLPWSFVTSLASPVSPAPSAAGTAYECDTSGGSIVFNLPAASTVGANIGFTFKKTAAANAITINANGSDLIDGAASLIIAGNSNAFSIFSDGANWQVVTGYAPISLSSAQGLQVANNATTPNTKADLTVSQAVLTTSTGVPYFYTGGTVTCDLTVSGAINGLDTGSKAVSTFYNLYLISNGSAVASLASLSATVPTLPSGYIYFMRVGAMITDSSGNLLRSIQNGRRAQYLISPLTALASGSVTFANFFPTTAEAALVFGQVTPSTGVAQINDMSGQSVLSLQTSSVTFTGSAIAAVQNIGLTTFNITLSGTGTAAAYGWIDRVAAT